MNLSKETFSKEKPETLELIFKASDSTMYLLTKIPEIVSYELIEALSEYYQSVSGLIASYAEVRKDEKKV